MTIEELLDKSAVELAAMSDEEVRAFFAPCLQWIRPGVENVGSATKEDSKKLRSKGNGNINTTLNAGKELAAALAKKYNIDINKI